MTGRLEQSEALHERARAFVRAFEAGRDAPESFDSLAADLARFQVNHVAGYERLCRARGVDPSAITRAIQAPAVPTDVFKLTRVAAFDESETRAIFRTSGTTRTARGAHAFRDVSTYDAGALAFGRHALASDWRARVPVLVLGPSPEEAPDSSLTHMLALFVRELGEPAALEDTFFVRGGEIALDRLIARVRALADRASPVLFLATSFALVHLLDALGDDRLALPKGSRVMQTGGYKGKSREVDASTLRDQVARAFAIERRAIVSEYGMTELSSQFYESREGVHVEPPWARVTPVDPETLAPLADGEIGIARITDLLNVDSAFAVLAHDRVRRVSGGFELLGRASGAPPRGCSIAIDELLGG